MSNWWSSEPSGWIRCRSNEFDVDLVEFSAELMGSASTWWVWCQTDGVRNRANGVLWWSDGILYRFDEIRIFVWLMIDLIDLSFKFDILFTCPNLIQLNFWSYGHTVSSNLDLEKCWLFYEESDRWAALPNLWMIRVFGEGVFISAVTFGSLSIR